MRQDDSNYFNPLDSLKVIDFLFTALQRKFILLVM